MAPVVSECCGGNPYYLTAVVRQAARQRAPGPNEGSEVGGGIPINLALPVLVLVRLLVATGALYFMWQVRHPKSE